MKGLTLSRLAGIRPVLKAIVFKVRVFALDGLLRPLRPMDMLRFGSYYGGWWIPAVDPSKGAAICVGAGLDVTFDLELQRLGYDVYAADPTPDSVKYVREYAPSLPLVPVGVWDTDGMLSFRQDATWGQSWMISEVAPDGASDIVESFPVTTVKGLMDLVGVSRVAILKLDIEGAEHRVIRSLIADGIKPDTLCIEFDDQRLRKVISSTRALRAYGYDLYQIENFNFIFALR